MQKMAMACLKIHNDLMKHAKIMKLPSKCSQHTQWENFQKKINPSYTAKKKQAQPEHDNTEGETYLQHTKGWSLEASHAKAYNPRT